MRLSQCWIVARHDLRLLRLKKSVLYALFAFPLGVSLGFPFLVGYIVARAGTDASLTGFLPSLINSFSFFFVIAGAILPTAIASYSIVGEKVEKSLEPLLSTPTTDGEILLGKSLAAFLPTILAIWTGSVLYQVLMVRETQGVLGYAYFPNGDMALILFALTPLACLFAIEVSVLLSSRVTDVREAQQFSGLVFFPFILLYVVSEIGIFPLNTANLFVVSAALGAAVLGLFGLSRRIFHREDILTRWK